MPAKVGELLRRLFGTKHHPFEMFEEIMTLIPILVVGRTAAQCEWMLQAAEGRGLGTTSLRRLIAENGAWTKRGLFHWAEEEMLQL
jgi:anti-sigma factor ChrR (cupin superfamily)